MRLVGGGDQWERFEYVKPPQKTPTDDLRQKRKFLVTPLLNHVPHYLPRIQISLGVPLGMQTLFKHVFFCHWQSCQSFVHLK